MSHPRMLRTMAGVGGVRKSMTQSSTAAELQFAMDRLPEYARFAGLHCEIQVQTILNHAWSETSHDIIYKDNLGPGFGKRALESGVWQFARIGMPVFRYQIAFLAPVVWQPSTARVDSLASNNFGLAPPPPSPRSTSRHFNLRRTSTWRGEAQADRQTIL
jgi:hypothetical protein